MIDGMDIDIEKKAMEQFKRELNDLELMFRVRRGGDEIKRICEALLKLRELGVLQRMNAELILCGNDEDAMHCDVHDLLDREEHLRLPMALHLLSDIFYDSLSGEGYLRVLRATVSHDDTTAYHVLYFLLMDEFVDPKIYVDHILDIKCNEAKLVDLRQQSFRDAGQFVEFLEILANPDNYADLYNQGYKTLNFKKVDDLLFSDDSDEALVLGGVKQEKN